MVGPMARWEHTPTEVPISVFYLCGPDAAGRLSGTQWDLEHLFPTNIWYCGGHSLGGTTESTSKVVARWLRPRVLALGALRDVLCEVGISVPLQYSD